MQSEKILKSIKLPTLSKTLYEIIELEKENPLSLLKDVKNIIEKDPLLSAHILKVANSAFYGFLHEVRSLSHAIGLLGMRKIRNIAFTFSVFDFIKRVDYQPEYGETFNLILKKSLLFSAVAAVLAKKINHLNLDECYVSGLLADIGQILLFLYAPGKYHEIYSSRDKKLAEQERKAFYTDHIQLGMAFCEQWNFPDYIKAGIKNHYELGSDTGHNKIAFIANQITELLLTEDESDIKDIFREVENHAKKLLHLSLSEVEETITSLPDIMQTYLNDFPEMQKELHKIIETGSSLIIKLMKQEMDMVLLAQELTDSQKRLAKEKIFLSHMLNLSYFFSSLMSPGKIINSLFEYFEHFITEFTIAFIYKEPGTENFLLMKGKEFDGQPIHIDDFHSLVKSRISNEAVRLEMAEMEKLAIEADKFTLVFPISYHTSFFGFLLLKVAKEDYLALDLEMSYVQILANIIANSFQNYFSFQGLKNETNKKELVTRELFEYDKELAQSRKALQRLQKSEMVGEMLPVIFHKLKNKITPVLGYAQILLTKVQDEGLRQRISKIEKNANELTDQLNFLRDYFKSDERVKEKENLNRIINGLKPYFDRVQAVENIRIHLDLGPGVPRDRLIPGQIEMLVTNMVENAALAIKEKVAKGGCREGDGVITIKTRQTPDADTYTLSIRDNGIGIEEKQTHDIWTPFYSQFPDRVGLGLSICEKIIANHEASRSIESVKGEFLEITVTFPFKEKPVEEEAPGYIARPGREAFHGKILIVDDEEYLVDLMEEVLMNEADFDIITRTSGPEALQLLRKDNRYDLIITDIRMPGTNGMEIYDFLRSKKLESNVIMVTADPYSDDVVTFLKKNKIDYLKKPFQLMEFKKKVLDKLVQK